MLREPFYRNFLREELEGRCHSNSRYSLRAFARSIGFEASVISQIISGKRVPTLKTGKRLVESLNLSPQLQFDFLNSIANTRKDRDTSRVGILKELNTYNALSKLDHEMFQMIADWYHYAILALTFDKNFKTDPRWISSQLDITVTQAKIALERLYRLEFLKKLPKGKVELKQNSFTTSNKKITTPALRLHQKQILKKSMESLENDPIESRSHNSMTLSIDPEKLSLAKSKIEDFINHLSTELEVGSKRQVYELSISLFPLQKNKKEIGNENLKN